MGAWGPGTFDIGDKALNVSINAHKGGPNAGRVTGTLLDSSP